MAVIIEANFALSVIAFVVAKFHRKPILLVQHVGKPSTVSRLARLVMRIGEKLATEPMVRNADVVVCVSPVVARHFARIRGKQKLLTIGHGIDHELFRFSANAEELAHDRKLLGLGGSGRLACFVGRLTKSKGISIIAEMARLCPDWTFAVAGIGPIDPSEWGLRNVLPLGQLDRADVARLYRISDVLVLPSHAESFSLVVREALASGSGVVCSSQILNTDKGLTPYITAVDVDLSDLNATAARFAEALARHEAGQLDGARAYVIDQCSQSEVGAQYIELINGLLSRQMVTSR
jgi:glycosyltransferase involved in cell wall biosynthesis